LGIPNIILSENGALLTQVDNMERRNQFGGRDGKGGADGIIIIGTDRVGDKAPIEFFIIYNAGVFRGLFYKYFENSRLYQILRFGRGRAGKKKRCKKSGGAADKILNFSHNTFKYSRIYGIAQ
jgi:hypothetical protein